MGTKYAMGIDFGTLSGRVLIVDIETGREAASVTKDYSHGVMDTCLPDGATRLGMDWALQHPGDYIEVLREAIPQALADAHISADDVVGVGIDATSCSVLPIDELGYPLCLREEHASNPHAYVKLWKHHAAQKEADAVNRIAAQRGESFPSYYGGKVSSESLIPKVWQVLNEAPDTYERAHRFIEVGDWIVMLLTGNEMRSSCMAGFKSLWNARTGHPGPEFFEALDPRLRDVAESKLSGTYHPIGARAGEVTARAAELTGLREGTAVSVACIDAHAAMPGVGITRPGNMLLIMGTSSCHIVLDFERRTIPGLCGLAQDGIIPGYFGYEAGQCCVGDHFEWFVNNCVPAHYQAEAMTRQIGVHQLLSEKAAELRAGESGLLALDWWNGNRSVLANADLTGMFIGCSLRTKPEELYRALIEATAFGTRMIIENYRNHGMRIDEIHAAGGIPRKNPVVMQMYADILNTKIRVSDSAQTSALGAAILGSVAAGQAGGGYASIADAAETMAKPGEKYYLPSRESVWVYDRLYAEYQRLHDYFGREGNDVMARLKSIQAEFLSR